MRRFLVILVSVTAAACFTQPVGRSQTSEAAAARLQAQSKQAYFDRVQVALEYAGEHPEDRFANRKAMLLATQAVRSVRAGREDAPDIATIIDWTEQVRANLATDEASCATNIDVAEMYRAANMGEPAADLLLDSARRCHHVPALILLARTLRGLKRCDELMPIAREMWPNAGTDDQVPLLDSVNICSNPVNLRSNLDFAPVQVIDDYFALLDDRVEQQRESYCMAGCGSAYSSCSQSCWSNRCGCDETYDLCTAMCR